MIKKTMTAEENPEQREQYSNMSFDTVSLKADRYLFEWATRG